MKFLHVKKGDQFFTNEGELLTAVRLHNTGEVGGHCIEFLREGTECRANGGICCGNCYHCKNSKEYKRPCLLTPADLHRRGIAVNCTIIFDEE